MMARRFALVMCVAGLLWAAPASAQSAALTPMTTLGAGMAAPTGGQGIGVRAFGHVELQKMTSKDTFDAVLGKTSLMGFGGGVEARDVWRSVFLRLSLSRMSKTGERVFVFDNQVYGLGIPLKVSLTPIELVAGVRSAPIGNRGLVSYVGGGALFMKYKESDPDEPSAAVKETYNGFVLVFGVDMPVWKKLAAGAELGWRRVNVGEPAGTLDAFGEKSLGGVYFRVMASIGK